MCRGGASPGVAGASRNAVTTSGMGVRRLRHTFGSALRYHVIFSRIMPGTSQDSRAASIWFSNAKGTVSVRPSRGCPGANR